MATDIYKGLPTTPLQAQTQGLLSQMGGPSFDYPDPKTEKGSGSTGGFTGSPMMASSGGDDDSDSGTLPMEEMQALQMQRQFAVDEYQALLKQARFFLPRTRKQIASEFGAQGNFYSGARADTQKQATFKTRFELESARRQLEMQLFQIQQQMQSILDSNDGAEAQAEANEQGMRSP